MYLNSWTSVWQMRTSVMAWLSLWSKRYLYCMCIPRSEVGEALFELPPLLLPSELGWSAVISSPLLLPLSCPMPRPPPRLLLLYHDHTLRSFSDRFGAFIKWSEVHVFHKRLRETTTSASQDEPFIRDIMYIK